MVNRFVIEFVLLYVWVFHYRYFYAMIRTRFLQFRRSQDCVAPFYLMQNIVFVFELCFALDISSRSECSTLLLKLVSATL